MAGEELLDKAIALIRIHALGHSREPLCSCGKCQLLAEYDAHRQRAGEEIGSICSAHRPRQAGCPRCYPTTVRVPREPTEAMLRTLADLLVLYLHPDATDLDDLDSRKEQTAYRDTADALWKAMLSGAEAER